MAILKKDVLIQFKKVHPTASDRITAYYFQDKWPGKSEFTTREVHEILQDADLLQQGYPLAQITGIAYFYGYKFFVNDRVLIPRPETEELVDWILEYDLEDCTILDIGTGSACIPIVLYLKSNAWSISTWEISPEALEIAQKNAKVHHADVNFELVDVLNLRTEHANTKWNIIVSNPPYVRKTESSVSITFEPEIALYVPENDPMLFYRKIGTWAIESLDPGGMLFFELSEFTYQQVEALLMDIGFREIDLRKDLQGKVRMLRALK